MRHVLFDYTKNKMLVFWSYRFEFMKESVIDNRDVVVGYIHTHLIRNNMFHK